MAPTHRVIHVVDQILKQDSSSDHDASNANAPDIVEEIVSQAHEDGVRVVEHDRGDGGGAAAIDRILDRLAEQQP